MGLRHEAHMLAVKLNGFDPGVLAGDESAGMAPLRETVARAGQVPLWGQSGEFEIEACGVPMRITTEGMIGLGSSFVRWPWFEAHAVEYARPFLLETGFKSFCPCLLPLTPGITPDDYVRRMVSARIEETCPLVMIEERYRKG